MINYQFDFARLKNSEFAYLVTQIISRIEADGTEALSVPEAILTSFKANLSTLVDREKESKIANETAKILEIRPKANSLLLCVFNRFETTKAISVASKQEAGTVLYNTTKTYRHIAKLSQAEFIQGVKGLLVDLAKEGVAEHVPTLGLQDEVAELSALVAKMEILKNQRTTNQALGRGKTSTLDIRKEMETQYNQIMCIVTAANLTAPSDVLTGFLNFVEQLLVETRRAYKQRTARTSTEETVTEEQPSTEESTPTEEQSPTEESTPTETTQ